MQFWNTTYNLNLKKKSYTHPLNGQTRTYKPKLDTKKNLLFALLTMTSIGFLTLFGFLNGQAQITQFNQLTEPITQINDVYSFYGLGTPYPRSFSVNRSMGHTSTAFRSRVNANPLNPASYTQLTLTSFEVAMDMDGVQITTDGTSGNSSNFGIGYFNLGFPINRNWGAGVGMSVFSKQNYSVRSARTVSEEIGPETLIYNGNGSLNNVRFGTAYKYKKLSVGANFAYVFGSLDKQFFNVYDNIEGVLTSDLASVYITNNPSSAILQRTTSAVGGVNWDIGLQYETNMGAKNNSLVIGASTSIFTGMKADEINEWQRGTYEETDINWQFINIPGDAVNADSAVYDIDYPNTYSLGLMWSDSSSRNWSFGLDVAYSQWSNFGKSNEASNLYQDEWRFSLGGSITPDDKDIKKYWKRVSYRLGLHYNTGYLNIRDTSIPSYGVTFGMGMPFSYKTVSRLNFSVDIGQKGSSKDGFVSELYGKVNLGFTFNSLWFIKRRYD